MDIVLTFRSGKPPKWFRLDHPYANPKLVWYLFFNGKKIHTMYVYEFFLPKEAEFSEGNHCFSAVFYGRDILVPYADNLQDAKRGLVEYVNKNNTLHLRGFLREEK